MNSKKKHLILDINGKFKNYTKRGLPKVGHFRKLGDHKLQMGCKTVRL